MKEGGEERAQLSPTTTTVDQKKAGRGLGGTIWGAMGFMGSLFSRGNKNDFEKRLQHLSKEEVAVHNRLKRRSQYWRKLARAIIIYAVVGEALALGFAIISTRSIEMPWQTRAIRVLPVFALPALVTLLYSTCAGYNRMRERKDQERLEKLKAERQEKINELKEKTNYYITQKLIQQYDPDPAAKAAAASVLASKLGAESGLKLALAAGLTSKEEVAAAQGKNPGSASEQMAPGPASSRDGLAADMVGLRNRKSQHRGPPDSLRQASSYGMAKMEEIAQGSDSPGGPGALEVWDEQGMDVRPPRNKASDGGWVARLAAMLVGEDPTQCYALICKNCHAHNGLAKKEDFQYITYYCPHCRTLNGSQQVEDGLQLNDEPDRVSPKPAQSKPMSAVEGSHSHRSEQSAAQTQELSGFATNTSPRNPEVSSSAAPALISQLISGDLVQVADHSGSSGESS